MVMNKRIALVIVGCAAVFLCLSSIGWALMYSPSENSPRDQLNNEEVLTPEQIRDAVMCYIEDNHPETAQFMNELAWSGGRDDTGLLGAETYNFESQGWTMTISYPVVMNPVYDVTADYSVPEGTISIPYAINWEGTWENGTITEANFVFAQ
jgi:hypothetical protein